MLTRSQYLTLTGLATTAALLVVTNGVLFASNKSAQSDINMRQATVQQTAQLQVLQTEIAKALAELAIKSDDKAVFDMLSANGLTVTKNANSAAKSDPSKR
ncbi:MAG: hypothetical protein ABI120_19320 [Gemmatimonadaceae bacterium]